MIVKLETKESKMFLIVHEVVLIKKMLQKRRQ